MFDEIVFAIVTQADRLASKMSSASLLISSFPSGLNLLDTSCKSDETYTVKQQLNHWDCIVQYRNIICLKTLIL